MQEKLIKKWSNLLLDRLLEHRTANPDFTFAVRQVNRYGRLNKGYWFQGDENYIFVGFTARSDESNKTRSVGLVFTNLSKAKADCWVEIVFKTEPIEELVTLYRHFMRINSGFEPIDQPSYQDYKFVKSYHQDDPLKNLDRFLTSDWKVLTEEVKKSGLGEIFFVPEQEFLRHLNRIETIRGKPLHSKNTNEIDMKLALEFVFDNGQPKNQLEVPVIIDNQEYTLLLEELNKHTPNGRHWEGEVEDLDPLCTVEFMEVDGVVIDLKYSDILSSFSKILYERLSDAIKDLREAESEGVEPTEIDELFEKDRARILDPYNPDEIKVRPSQFPVFQIFDMINKQDIDLNPDFQRHLVWDMKRKSRLIESILLGIPLPVFYFSQNREGVFHVVDGLQRLTTIRDFMSNKFYLRHLEHLDMCDGKYFGIGDKIPQNKALERRFQRRIEQTQLSVNIIESSSPPKVKYDIFKRINEGGKPLNQQEIRNSLAKPHTRKLMKDLAYSNEFILATGGYIDKNIPGVSDQRMGAQEMVLRYAGFHLVKRGIATYLGDMNGFLDDTIDKLNALSEKEIDNIRVSFLRGIANCYHLFGQYCFRKCLSHHLQPNASKQLINKSLFTTWSIEMGKIQEERVKKIEFESFSKILAEELDKKDTYYTVVTLRTNDRSYLEEAFRITERIIKEKL